MSVLVIGSNGYMGRNLMAALSNNQIPVNGASSSNGTGIDPASGMLSESFLIPAGTSVVVYMAQSPYFRQVPEQAVHVLTVNALSVARAAVLARAAGVSRFIYVSTGTVYAPSFSPLSEASPVRRDNWYSLSKLHGEEVLSLFRSDMEIVVVRPFGVYGPTQSGRLVQNLIDSVQHGKPITLQPRAGCPNDQDGLKISICFIEDATRILLELVCKGSFPCLNLAGDEALSIRSMANQIGAILGRDPKFVISATPRDSDLIADTTLQKSFTEIRPIPFADGLRRTVRLSNASAVR